jgi:nucleotide-binding universal stress UspA family protein
MKKILVPIDFSEFSINAAKYAAELAKKFDSTIYFLHVVSIPIVEGNMPFHEKQNIAEGLFILKHVKNKFKALFEEPFLKGIKVAEAVQFDGVYESITVLAEKNNIDLIVMGTHGESGVINDFFVGTLTEKIVRRSSIPVISIREQAESPSISKIVFASDFEDDIVSSFQFIKKLAASFNAEILLLRVVTKFDFISTAECVSLMENFASNEQLSKYSCHVYNASDVQQGINEFAVSNNVDLITTATSGRKGLALLLNGSVASDVLKKAKVPVLTMRIK